MPRFVAFLRGVSPMNAKMPELKRAFESAGFTEVKTLLSSGNVVFNSRNAALDVLSRKAEKAMLSTLGRSFVTTVRRTQFLQDMLASDPFAEFELPDEAKRVITFMRRAGGVGGPMPIEQNGAIILKVVASEIYSAYLPSADGPVFMRLLERTFGVDITTRTLDTVRKCAEA